MFQDYSSRDYMKICYLLLRPQDTPERFMKHFSMSRYEYAICQQRITEMQSFYGVRFSFKEETIDWEIVDEQQFQQHYKGMWSFYNRHRFYFSENDDLVRGLYIAKTILLAPDCTDLESLAEKMGFVPQQSAQCH